MNVAIEQHLWDRIRTADKHGPLPRDVIAEMVSSGTIQSPKQAWRTLEKWCDRGIYNYGVSLDLGWKECEELPSTVSDQAPAHSPGENGSKPDG